MATSHLAAETLALAVSHHLSGRLDEALQAIDNAATAAPVMPELTLAKAQILLDQGKTALAAVEFRKFLNDNNSHAVAHHNLAICLKIAGDLAGAKSHFGAAHTLDPRLLQSCLGQASCLLYLNQPEKALGLFEQILSQNSSHAEALLGKAAAMEMLGIQHFEAHDVERAAVYFEQCIPLRPSWLEAHLNLAICQLQLNHLDAAQSSFQSALQIDPKHAGPVRGLASIALRTGRLEEALELHQHLAESGGATPEVFYNLGLLLQNAGRLRDAAQCYERSASLRPNFVEALLNLGHVLRELGEEEHADVVWQDAVRADPAIAVSYFGG